MNASKNFKIFYNVNHRMPYLSANYELAIYRVGHPMHKLENFDPKISHSYEHIYNRYRVRIFLTRSIFH